MRLLLFDSSEAHASAPVDRALNFVGLILDQLMDPPNLHFFVCGLSLFVAILVQLQKLIDLRPLLVTLDVAEQRDSLRGLHGRFRLGEACVVWHRAISTVEGRPKSSPGPFERLLDRIATVLHHGL